MKTEIAYTYPEIPLETPWGMLIMSFRDPTPSVSQFSRFLNRESEQNACAAAYGTVKVNGVEIYLRREFSYRKRFNPTTDAMEPYLALTYNYDRRTDSKPWDFRAGYASTLLRQLPVYIEKALRERPDLVREARLTTLKLNVQDCERRIGEARETLRSIQRELVQARVALREAKQKKST